MEEKKTAWKIIPFAENCLVRTCVPVLALKGSPVDICRRKLHVVKDSTAQQRLEEGDDIVNLDVVCYNEPPGPQLVLVLG